MNGKEIFALGTNIQIYDNRKVVLSSCKRIVEYNDIYLKADLGGLMAEIWGRELCVNDFNKEGIDVYGHIESVVLSEIPGRKKTFI
ncbi:MAG: hypothetical protein E7505_07365 [Ruminococcus sp.]|jgi:hypothetical protein|nr:hypothetical protein [Ruminococcus sp.]